MRAAQPLDGICPTLGRKMERPELREMNEAHASEFGVPVNDAVEQALEESKKQVEIAKVAAAEQRERKQLEAAKRAEDRKLRVELRQKEAEEAKAKKLREREENRENRRIEMSRTRLEKARELAEKRLEEARRQLETQMAALQRVNQAVQFSMDGQIPEMFMDAVFNDVVVIEEAEEDSELEDDREEEEREEESDQKLLRFGTKELDRYVPVESADEETKYLLNLHQECELSFDSKMLIDNAERKFRSLLKRHIQAQRTHRLRANLTTRLLQRYMSVLKFILNEKREYMCSPQKVRCYDLDAVFGALPVPDIEILIAHSTELVQSLEESCPQYLFSTFYMTLDGKTDRLV